MRDLARGRRTTPSSTPRPTPSATLDIDLDLFASFLASMQMDITVTGYQTYADLQVYTHGSAMVIGLMMLPVLGPLHPRPRPPAELSARRSSCRTSSATSARTSSGRVYLPQEDMDRFGVTREHLAAGEVTDDIRKLIAFEIGRTRDLYAVAWPGVELVEPTSRPCLRTAIELYGGILDEVERADYQVLTGRVSVPARQRARVAGRRTSARCGAARCSPPDPPAPPEHPPGERLQHEREAEGDVLDRREQHAPLAERDSLEPPTTADPS